MKNSQRRRTQFTIIILLSITFSILLIATAYAIADQKVFIPFIQKQEAQITPTSTPTQTALPSETSTPGEDYIWLVVRPENPDKDWALCYFVKKYNDSGKPVMEIYPSETSPASERIKIARGERVQAHDGIIKADGGLKFWKLVDYLGDEGEELYLRQVDVMKEEDALQ